MALLLLCLTFFSAFTALAQIAIVDTRADEPSTPEVRIVGGTGEGGGISKHSPLKLELSVDEDRPQLGDPFAYELLLTNRSDKDVMVPRSVRWSDTADKNGRPQTYQELAISFAVVGRDGNKLPFNAILSLYGSKDNPDSMVALGPGESMRILGSTYLYPKLAPNAEPPAGNLQAYLAVNSVNLVPVAGANCSDCFLDHERHLYWTQSENPVQIEFQGMGHQ
jgi:hypothetical protein